MPCRVRQCFDRWDLIGRTPRRISTLIYCMLVSEANVILSLAAIPCVRSCPDGLLPIEACFLLLSPSLRSRLAINLTLFFPLMGFIVKRNKIECAVCYFCCERFDGRELTVVG